jgi:hypothetical protein
MPRPSTSSASSSSGRGVPVERGVELAGIDQPGPAQTSLACRLRHLSAAPPGRREQHRAAAGRHPVQGPRLPADLPARGPGGRRAGRRRRAHLPGRSRDAVLLPARHAGDLADALPAPTGWLRRGEPVTVARLQAIADQYTGGRLRLRDPVWISDFRSTTAALPGTGPARCSWSATPPTCTARRAPRA